MCGGNGTGVAGSTFTQYDYPPIYQYDNFHHCGLEPDDNIVNYDNAVEVQTCQLDGLAEYVLLSFRDRFFQIRSVESSFFILLALVALPQRRNMSERR